MLDDVFWIASEGGPLLLLPLSKSELWWGVFGPPDPNNPEEVLWPSDYDRLGEAINDYIIIFLVDGVEAAAFGDMPLLTTTWCADTYLRYFAQVLYSEGLHQVIHILKKGDFPNHWKELCHYQVSDTEMVFFDAALQGGSAIEYGLYLTMPIGLYKFEYCIYNPDPHTELILYRMVLDSIA